MSRKKEPTTGTCPDCGETIDLTKKGKIDKHEIRWSAKFGRVHGVQPCDGVGKNPKTS